MEIMAKLPTPCELKQQLALSPQVLADKASKDGEIAAILRGDDRRLLLIIGPCSANNPPAVLDYAHRLAERAGQVADKMLVALRVYTAKPRTDCRGFLGLLHQPGGLPTARKLHLDVLEQTGLPTADELLYTALMPYFDDLVSYFAVGARSVENQEHRLVASGALAPVGMKNPLSGEIAPMLTAINAAKAPHNFIYRDCEVQTTGNPLAHGILRGGQAPNYGGDVLARMTEPVIVDCSHGNSAKNPLRQRDVALDVLKSRKKQPLVRGLMIESFTMGGSGSLYGQSITDPCLSWTDTRNLIEEIAFSL
ncbi:MAG: 3-deoxy-7-phosphoheptulonate synthase [Defluviitaleaceae bacterium]|nr:3-deoxy-7-phosphoheptulonate synthase [Defluviitaleaceae bacterium]